MRGPRANVVEPWWVRGVLGLRARQADARGHGLAALALSALLLLIGTSAANAATTSSPITFSPTSSTAVQSGLTAGAVDAHYQMGSMSVETVTPPASFDAATASAAQLAAYGIPSEPPASSPVHADWEQMIHNLHFANVTGLQTGPPASGSCPDSLYFCNVYWSGNIANGAQNSINDVETYYYEPNIDTSECASNPDRGDYLWNGLGGQETPANPNEVLAQNGSGTYVYDGTLDYSHAAWFEIVAPGIPLYAMFLTPTFNFTVGGEVLIITKYVGVVSGQNEWEFYWYNAATGTAPSIVYASTSTSYPIYNSAELIAEIPGSGAGPGSGSGDGYSMTPYSPWAAPAAYYNSYTGTIDNASTAYDALYNTSTGDAVSLGYPVAAPGAGAVWSACS
jgi:hypothetical protein